MLKLLKKLVEIDSCSGNAKGVNAVQSILAQELTEMGFKCRSIPNPKLNDSSGDLLVGESPGEESGYVDFLSHADTVSCANPRTALPTMEFSPDLSLAYGPGIIDDKGGQVVCLEGLRRFLSYGCTPKHSLRFISSPSEERGSPGFQELFQKYSQDSKLVLGFEPALEDGSIVHSRRGNRWYHVRVKGKESHSGRAFFEGRSANHFLIERLNNIQKLTSKDEEVSLNVGAILGGTQFNVVCAYAESKIDARFSSLQSRAQVHEKIDQEFSTMVQGIQSEYEIVDDCPPFELNDYSRSYLSSYLDTLRRIEGRRVEATFSGGSSDCCYFGRENLPILDGLGPLGGGMHTASEYLLVSSLVTRAEAFEVFLNQNFKGKDLSFPLSTHTQGSQHWLAPEI